MSKRALLLVNRHARQGQDALGPLLDALRGSGLEVVEPPHDKSTPLSEQFRRHKSQVDLVIVGGGDGTLNAAAEGLIELDVPLGILPLGTANDLARTLGLPTDPVEACRVIAEGHTRRIDVGSVNGKLFFNVASIGLTVDIARSLSKQSKSRWGVLAYVWTALKVFWNARPFHAQIHADFQSLTGKTVQIAVGNGKHYGGGMTVAEDASIDDGNLDLYSLEIAHWWQMLPLLAAIRNGTLNDRPNVRTLRGKEFQVTTHRPRSINTDGEITTKTPAIFTILPRALSVFVPRP